MRKRVVLIGLSVWSLFGCGFDDSPTGSAVCVEGQSAECACEGGARGLHTCSDGAYGACVCGPSASAGGLASGGDGEDAAGSGAGAAAGSGGAASTAAAGSDASAPPDEAGSGGHGGEAAAGAGGAGGTGGAGSGAAGSGTAGSADAGRGAAGAGDAGSDTDPPPAEPGTVYGFCKAQGECEDGMICYTLTVNGGVTGYCAPPCSFTGGGGSGLGSCVQPASGDVRAQCAPFLGLCVLASCEGQDCPSGMSCVQTSLPLPQQQGTFDCRYPIQ
jgi:hypothetical protein